MDRAHGTTKSRTSPVALRKSDLDEEEQQIEKDLDAGLYVPVADVAKAREEAKLAAINTYRKKPVTLRLTNLMIGQLKHKAKEEGLPYQTLINSVLHKYLSGKFVERD